MFSILPRIVKSQTNLNDGSNCGATIILPAPAQTCNHSTQHIKDKEMWFEFTNNSPDLSIDLITSKDYIPEKISRISLFDGCPDLTKMAEKNLNDGTPPRLEVTNLAIDHTYYLRVERETPTIGIPIKEIDFGICLRHRISNVVGPNSDCATAVVVTCTTNTINQPGLNGIGDVNEVSNSNSCFFKGERQSIWYSFTFSISGTFTFTIDPAIDSDDFDFALFDITNGCASKGNSIRCSYDNTGGNTGLNFTETDLTEGEFGGNGYLAKLIAETNHTYALLVDNYWMTGNGFNLTFAGKAVFSGNMPTAQFTFSPTPACVDSKVYFTNQSTDAISYYWDFGSNSTTAFIPISYTYHSDGIYTISLTATNHCGSSLSEQKITVNPKPTLSISPSTNIFCSGIPLTLTASGNGDSYVWSEGTNGSTLSIIPTVSTDYTVTATFTSTGCSNTAKKTLTITNTTAVTDFSFSKYNNVEEFEVSFNFTPSTGANYTWDFMDGTTYTQNTSPVLHTFLYPGNYRVTLTSTAPCSTIVTKDIFIIPNQGSYAPTPDCLNGFIYDFYGDQIISTTPPPWNSPGSPIKIQGIVTIKSGATLKIMNGTEVWFGPPWENYS